jgi:hypothetical protein
MILENLHDNVMHVISPLDSYQEMMKQLNAAFGFAHVDPSSLKKELRSIVLSPGKTPSVTFDYMDRKITELDAAVGTVKDNDLVQYLYDALSGDYQRNTFQEQFYPYQYHSIEHQIFQLIRGEQMGSKHNNIRGSQSGITKCILAP